MEAEACLIGLDRVGVDVLELGAGVGWLGMCLAANLRQAHTITCTEQASGGAIDWLRQNVDKNSHLDLSRLRCCVCDWTWFDSNHTSHKPGQDTDPSSANISGSSVRMWESGACISPDPASSGMIFTYMDIDDILVANNHKIDVLLTEIGAFAACCDGQIDVSLL